MSQDTQGAVDIGPLKAPFHWRGACGHGRKSAPYVCFYSARPLKETRREEKSPYWHWVKVRSFQENERPVLRLHSRGGPLVFEGWSDDSGMLFVYKKEITRNSSEHVRHPSPACHFRDKCTCTTTILEAPKQCRNSVRTHCWLAAFTLRFSSFSLFIFILHRFNTDVTLNQSFKGAVCKIVD